MSSGPSNQQAAPPAPTYAAPPSAAEQYTDVMEWNISNAPRILASRRQFDPQFAELEMDTMAQTAERGIQNFTDLFERYGDELATANKDFAIKADPLGAERNQFIKDQITAPTDTEVADRLRGLLDSPFQKRGLTDALEALGMADLERGASLSPEIEAELEDRVRTAQTARGTILSPTSAFQELMTKGSAGEALKQQRIGNAMNIAGIVRESDAFDLEGKMQLLRSLGTEKLQGPASKATFLGLSAPPRLGETTGAFGAGYKPTSINSPFNNFADINSTAGINNSIANFHSDMFRTQSGNVLGQNQINAQYGRSAMDNIGSGMDMASGFLGMGAMAAMI